MVAQNKTTIKSYFETNDRPTQGQFADLIDSYIDTLGPIGALASAIALGATGVVTVSASSPDISSYASVRSSMGLTVYTTALSNGVITDRIATTAQATAAVSNSVLMTPYMTAYQITDRIATTAQAVSADNNFNLMTPQLTRIASGVKQVLYTIYSGVDTTTTQIPYDDSIPQIGEGKEFMTQAITPTATTSKLRVDVIFNFAQTGATSNTIVGLFRDAGSDAVAAAAMNNPSGGVPEQIILSYLVTANSVSPTTFRVRGGPGSAETLTFNGAGGARKLGGSMDSIITITEYA